MPVRFDPYKSMYVDRHSGKIAETLRNRFVQNYATQDTLQTKLNELQAAPFEGDQAAKERLSQQITSQLESFAERGDYENMTMDIAKTARQYQDQALPIAQNSAAFSADKAAKEKMLADGDISLQTFNDWMRRATMQLDSSTGQYVPYQGLQFDQDNKPVAGSFYRGSNLAKDVDVQGEILAELNKLDKVKTGGGVVKQYETVNGIEYAITRGNTIVEQIPAETIQMVTDGVLSRPDVSSFLAQQSEFRTMDMSPEEMASLISTQAAGLRENGSPAALEQAAKLESSLNSGNLMEIRNSARQAYLSQEANRYTTTAIMANLPSEYGGSFEMKYGETYIEGLKNAGIASPSGALDFIGKNDEVVSPFTSPEGIVSPSSIKSSIEDANVKMDVAIESLQRIVPQFAEADRTQILEQIKNMNIDEVRNLSNVASEVDYLLEAKHIIDTQQTIIDVANRLQKETYNSVDFDVNSYIAGVQAETATELGISTEEFATKLYEATGGEFDPETIGKAVGERIAAANFAHAAGGDLLAVVSEGIQSYSGLDASKAKAIAAQVINDNEGVRFAAKGIPDYFTPLNDEANDILKELFFTANNHANSKQKLYAEALQNSGSSVINFPRTVFTDKNNKAIADQMTKMLKSLTAESIAPVTLIGSGGKSLGDIINENGLGLNNADPENINIEEVYYTTGIEHGIPVPAVELKLTSGTGANKKTADSTIKVPLNQIAPYSQGLGEQLNRAMSTPADKVLNNVRLQFAHAPSISNKGYNYTYSDSKGNRIYFTFIPQLGANGAIMGYQDIVATGMFNGNVVNTKFIDENAFHAQFNDMMAQSTNSAE